MRSFLLDESGNTFTEYSLILAMGCLLLIASIHSDIRIGASNTLSSLVTAL